jgi:anaerobic selenocysteine-containing dehydrogenase/ferredoxin-NADP reductase
MEQKSGFCTLCRSRCGTINTVDNGRLIAVAASPEHPTGRATCAKGRAAPEIAHSTRRLMRPLRRTRPKDDPDPGWVEIEWDEALDEIAAQFGRMRAQHGAESLAFAVSSPSGTPMSDSYEWVERFARVFGTPNFCNAIEICNWHKDYAHAFTFGSGLPPADYLHSDLIILWGFNPAASWLAVAGMVEEARARGAKLIVVDPRRSSHAVQADHWLRVRPGSDAALALGLAHLMIKNKAFDDAFLRGWTNAPFLVRSDNGMLLRAADIDAAADAGQYVVWNTTGNHAQLYDPAVAVAEDAAAAFALEGRFQIRCGEVLVACRPVFDLYREACAQYTPAYVSEVTWVAESDLLAAADTLMNAQRVSYHCWTGVAQHTNSTQMDRAIAVLYALTGCFDAPGGNLQLIRQPINRVNDYSLLSESQRAKALGLERFPLGPPSSGWVAADDLYTAMIEGAPYRVRGLIGFGANILVSLPDTRRGREALSRLEFHVHCDLFETPTARYADIVLPINSPWEREGLRTGFEISADAENLIQLRQQMIPVQGQSRSDLSVVFALATRLGMSAEFFDGNIDAAWNHMLAPLGLTVEQLRQHPEGIRHPVAQQPRKYAQVGERGVRGFATPTRRVEIYSELLLRHGYPALPTHREPADGVPPVAWKNAIYPCILTSARSGYFCHSQHRGIASLRRRAQEPMVEIGTALAEAKGIAQGDWVLVKTRVGEARFRARVSEDLHPAVVVADYGWWQENQDLALPGYDPFSDVGSNFNALVAVDHADPLSGAVPMRSFPCDIELDTRRSQSGWHGFRAFRVARKTAEADGVVSIDLMPTAAGSLPDFGPGQHMSIRIENMPVHGTVTRAYSLSGKAWIDGREGYRISVKQVIDRTGDGQVNEGIMSSYLTRELRLGEIVHAQPPAGHFRIPVKADFPVVLLAAGIGITPFISYLETLVDASDPPEVILLYGSRNSANHVFRDRIAELGRQLPNLKVIDYYSQPVAGEVQGRDYNRPGRISAQAIEQSWIDRRARFYLCGPDAMLQTMVSGLIERGVPRFEIFKEAFSSPPAPSAMTTGGPWRVQFARSNRELIWKPGNGSLLSFAEACGVTIPSGCRTGQCESCAVTVLSGQVHHQTVLDLDDSQTCLTCQAIPQSDLILDA